MTETLQEFSDSCGVAMRVDRRAGVIRGVKILGLKSRNGRIYLPEALSKAVGLYEEAKVNVNHPKGHPGRPRDYQDRIGVIRNVVVQPGEGLFADLHFNPKHALAEQLAWDAEHAPENVGFSHNVQAQTRRDGQRLVVEAITHVQSVDLVADPATTRGLFEADDQADGDEASGVEADADGPAADPAEQRQTHALEEVCREQAAEIERLQAELQRLTALDAEHQKQAMVRRLLREFNLSEADDPQAGSVVSPRFLESLLAAENEQTMRALIRERCELIHALRGETPLTRLQASPVSRDQYLLQAASRIDTQTFVEAIT